MRRSPNRRTATRLAALTGVLVVPLAVAGCSGGTSASTTTTAVPSTTSSTASPAQIAQVKAAQIALAALGCYSGSIDGILGSATTRAIATFQNLAGIKADGVYGATTESRALTDVRTGKKVCTSSTTSTTIATPTTTGSSTSTSTVPVTTTTGVVVTTTTAPA